MEDLGQMCVSLMALVYIVIHFYTRSLPKSRFCAPRSGTLHQPHRGLMARSSRRLHLCDLSELSPQKATRLGSFRGHDRCRLGLKTPCGRASGWVFWYEVALKHKGLSHDQVPVTHCLWLHVKSISFRLRPTIHLPKKPL